MSRSVVSRSISSRAALVDFDWRSRKVGEKIVCSPEWIVSRYLVKPVLMDNVFLRSSLTDSRN